jgi:hypothetical protein
VSVNDQTRVMDLAGPTWTEPNPVDGGANPNGYETSPILPGASTSEAGNDGALSARTSTSSQTDASLPRVEPPTTTSREQTVLSSDRPTSRGFATAGSSTPRPIPGRRPEK